ncbi:MAG TPA: hypothetical protein VF322_09545 [Gammaproteobacteria bacterium]
MSSQALPAVPPLGTRPERASPRAAAARRERTFFGSMAIACALIVLLGFSRTYYLNGWMPAPFALTPLLHLHGAVFTGWMLLLLAQTALIAAHRVDLHRRLGIAGAALAAVMIVLGPAVAITRTAQGVIADHGAPPLVFLAVPLVGMAVFAVLVGAALYFRRRAPAAHKRLMLLATLEIAMAGTARLPVVESWGPLGFFGVTDLLVLALAAYDLASTRRLHPATLWGGLLFVASQPLRLAIGGSALWLTFAAWLTA